MEKRKRAHLPQAKGQSSKELVDHESDLLINDGFQIPIKK